MDVTVTTYLLERKKRYPIEFFPGYLAGQFNQFTTELLQRYTARIATY